MSRSTPNLPAITTGSTAMVPSAPTAIRCARPPASQKRELHSAPGSTLWTFPVEPMRKIVPSERTARSTAVMSLSGPWPSLWSRELGSATK